MSSHQATLSGTDEYEKGKMRGEHKRGSVGKAYTPTHETNNIYNADSQRNMIQNMYTRHVATKPIALV